MAPSRLDDEAVGGLMPPSARSYGVFEWPGLGLYVRRATQKHGSLRSAGGGEIRLSGSISWGGVAHLSRNSAAWRNYNSLLQLAAARNQMATPMPAEAAATSSSRE